MSANDPKRTFIAFGPPVHLHPSIRTTTHSLRYGADRLELSFVKSATLNWKKAPDIASG